MRRLYEFECSNGHKFEKFIDEEIHLDICPECGFIAERVISVVNHTFGWTLSDRSHERFGPRDEFVKNV